MQSREKADRSKKTSQKASRLPSGGGALSAATLLAILVKLFLVDLAVVDGRSMEPFFSRGSIVLVVRCAYGLRSPGPRGSYGIRWADPRPGDIVLAYPEASGRQVVKRILAVGPIERGTPLRGGNGEGYPRVTLQRGEVFLLGDNPPESRDSRDYGPVRVAEISGRAVRIRL